MNTNFSDLKEKILGRLQKKDRPAAEYEQAVERKGGLGNAVRSALGEDPPVSGGRDQFIHDPASEKKLHHKTRRMDAASYEGGSVFFVVIGAFFLMAAAAAAVFFIAVKGPEEVLVPNVEGKDLTAALIAMQEKELYPRIQTRYTDSSADKGLVLSQDPAAGSIVKAYGRVNLVVSGGLILAELEDYVGRQFDDVELSLQGSADGTGLLSLAQPLYKADVSQAGTIIAQEPAAGSPITGPLRLTLVVSSGPVYDQARVPDLVGMNVNDILGQLGRTKVIFDFTSREAAAGETAGTVASQQTGTDEFVANYSRISAEFLSSSQPDQSGNLYGLFTAELPQYPNAVPMRLEAQTPDGETYQLLSFSHPGGSLSIPYGVPSGTILTLYVSDRAAQEMTVQ